MLSYAYVILRMNKTEYRAGDKYNHLTLVAPAGQAKNRHPAWEVRCDCGKVYVIGVYDVVSGHTKSCGCMRKNRVGEKHGMLTFVKPTNKKLHDRQAWECICDCGRITYAVANEVVSGNVKSCGCLADSKRYNDPSIRTAHIVHNRYKDGGLDFPTFYALSQQPCDYCGRLPHRSYNRGKRKGGEFTYNGLDRVDNNKAHTVDNVVPCCWDCNDMKGSRTRDEFISHIERIHTHACVPEKYASGVGCSLTRRRNRSEARRCSPRSASAHAGPPTKRFCRASHSAPEPSP